MKGAVRVEGIREKKPLCGSTYKILRKKKGPVERLGRGIMHRGADEGWIARNGLRARLKQRKGNGARLRSSEEKER